MRPVRVLELRSVRGTGGGPEKTILLGTAATDRSKYEITVCYLRDQRDEVFSIHQWAERLGVEYIELRERHSLDWAIWPRLRQIVRQRRIDIIHAHDYKTNLLALTAASLEGIVPLSTVHGYTGHSWRERCVYYPADKRVLAWFPRLVAVSSEIRRELVRCGAQPRRIDVVLNGIDHRLFVRKPEQRARMRHQLHLSDEHLVIGTVGRLEPQKRFDLLIDAVARVLPCRRNVRLLIAGDGSSRELLARCIHQRSLGDAVRLLGHREDIQDFHHALDLFVQSSTYEGTPNAVLEAMALESPVVATDVGGTSELIEHEVHGLLVPPGDSDALAGAIQRALDDLDATAGRARAARVRVEQDLSFERRMRRVEAIYDELVPLSRHSRLTPAALAS
jgi:glycosyltransferase involved in cell wall biosynthesis